MVTKKEKLHEDNLKSKARNLSVKEGIFTSARGSLTDSYIQPFAIAIQSSNSVVALIRAIAGLLGPISQLFGSKLMKKNSRKSIIINSFIWNGIFSLLFVSIALLYSKEIITGLLPLIFIIFFILYTFSFWIGYPAWFSWIGDIINEKHRGKWFSKRNFIIGFVAISTAIISGFLLDFLKTKNLEMWGFGIFFFISFLFRLIPIKDLKKSYEPKMEKIKNKDEISFLDFFMNLKRSNLGRFAIFRFFLIFSASISTPLLAVYLLRNLGLQYSTYMILIFTGTFYSILFMELWGRISDRFGDYKIISIATLFIPLIPILWIISSNFWYLLVVPSFIGGVSWAGFYLGERNFLYDNTEPDKRASLVSYYNLILGIGIFLGGSLGALLVKILEGNLVQPIFIIFIISSILSMASIYVLLPKVKETKKVKKTSSHQFRKIVLKEIKPTLINEYHEMMSLRKYLKYK